MIQSSSCISLFFSIFNSAEKWPVNIRFPLSLFFGKKEFFHSYRRNVILISSLMSNRNNRKFKITVVWTHKCSFSSVNISRCTVLGYFESPMKSSRTLTVLAFLLHYLRAWLLSSKTSHGFETSKWLLESRFFSPHSCSRKKEGGSFVKRMYTPELAFLNSILWRSA